MSHEHVHHTYEETSGLGTGMVIGVMLALLVIIVAAFFYFGGFFAGAGNGTDNGGSGSSGGSGGTGESAPASYQYIVPDYQVAVR